MENPMENIAGALKSLKNKNIRFNPNPWKTKDDISTTTKINVEDDTFVDLHVEVAKKVDALIDNMDKEGEETIFGKVKSTLKK